MSATDGQPGLAENSWGTNPTEQRQTKLEEMLHEWEMESNHGDRLGPFEREALSGADAFWLAIHAFPDIDKAKVKKRLDTPFTYMLGDSGLSIEGGGLVQQHLKDAFLTGAHLKKAILTKAYLEGTNLEGVDLEGADLRGVDLEGANLRRANLRGANLRGANLRKADLVDANLCEADVTKADLQGANLFKADFRKANFYKADLQGASFVRAKLAGANLSHAVFGMRTDLGEAKLGDQDLGHMSDADTIWNDVILASADWSALLEGVRLGDDRQEEALVAARANQQLALALRAQGLNAEASELDYRARMWRLRDLWQKRRTHFPAFVISGLVFLVSGYGYRPIHSFGAYAATILVFMGLYLLNSHFVAPHLTWDEALVLSMSSFHGRGFFSSTISLGDTYARLSVVEAFIGLLIEATLIATFTQRIFR